MVDEVCLNDALLAGTKEVFETMIFMDLEETTEPNQKIEGDALLGSITFKNEVEGCLTICCTVTCAKIIAANMLGTDPEEEISEEEICDAIGEVTNMVMGSVKARIQDSISGLRVSIPTVVRGQHIKNSLGDGTSKVLAKFSIEDEYIIELSLLYRESSK